MNCICIVLAGALILCSCNYCYGQQPAEILSAAAEEQLEHNTVNPEDDTRWQQLQAYARHKVSLNSADAATLQSLGMLTPLQVNNLLSYRRLLGAFVSIYELQAVPGFDEALIRRLLPYVSTGDGLAPQYSFRDYLRKGQHSLLLRYGRQLETARGYKRADTVPPHYAGTPDQLLVRYRYNFPRYASWGITMEKDAGEQFFKGAQQQGFDFYSMHLFIRNYKNIKALALGDFTVNMGQGLLQWHSLAFGKSAIVMQVKREGEVLRPYVSSGEHYFFRGAGVTLQQGHWQATGFVSLRRLDGNTGELDTLEAAPYISSFVTNGYHRTAVEAAKRGAVQQLSAGGNAVYDNGNWRMGVNVIQHHFSTPILKNDAPYNLFAPEGKQLFNTSFDYSGNWKQVHFFGELATDAHGHIATVNGLLTSVAPAADVALVYRYYDKRYQSLYSNAFGNNYRPVNESGWYTAITLRLTPQLRCEGYADLFCFPWLKYRTNAPSAGNELLAALTYTPDKHTEAFIRYRHQAGMENETGGSRYIAAPVRVITNSWRCQVSLPLSAQLQLRSRLEWTYYSKAFAKQQGWLCYQELQYRFTSLPLRASGRITWFGAGGAGATMYAIESSMLSNYSVSQLSGEGWQYAINLRWNITRRLVLGMRWSQAIYANAVAVGSGWDTVDGGQKTAVQLQLQHLF
ncbi:helix-hairpin-helix domain-containing protein [Chitinophaga agrisoli]|uniref:Helix-hairpin-helix domain-containing protein n=1 Tax=Chitinophaga agrisoli TaxID=2607653 RepID=A0A5B2VQF4_9BACT|nr:helix-hairpin-helix domain-containing protein [Chitinophaga agrisoli]KAA2240462.1 helix-hairpin-helix domain-containing protein [Chitinophaga agrisoli]